MSKRKRKRVTRLTEEDYNNYIMSLKDETPINKCFGDKDDSHRY